jgi:hypothetical protein
MRVLKQILFTAALLVGLAFTASAQNNDQPRKPPPKEDKNIPKIVVPEGKKPPPTPKPPKDGKKPGFAFIETRRETVGNLV